MSAVSGFRRSRAGGKRAGPAPSERDRRGRPGEERCLRGGEAPGPAEERGRLVDGAELREAQRGAGQQAWLVGKRARDGVQIGARVGAVSRPSRALRPYQESRRP